MTEHLQINDVVPRIQYDCDGVQAAFIFPFVVFRATDLEVWQDGVRVNGGFAVSGAGISGGGSVLFTVPPPQGSSLTLRRRVTLERTSDFQADGIIRAKTLNDELDYQVAAVQQVADDVSRCLKRPFTSRATGDLSLPEPQAGRALKWNDDGSGLVNSTVDPDAVVVVENAVAVVQALSRQVESDAAAATAAQAEAISQSAAARDFARMAQDALGISYRLAGLRFDPATDTLRLSLVADGPVDPTAFDAMTMLPSGGELVLDDDTTLHLHLNA